MKTLKNFKEEKKSLRTSNPCWTGYHPVGTKQKGGRTVPNCVPEEVSEARDHEYSDPHMAVNQLKTIMHNAEELMELIGDNTDLPEWVESKITLAEDYIMTVANYMRSELKEEVEQIDELSKGTLTSYRTKAKAHADKLSADFKAGDRSVKRAVTIAKRDKGYLKAGTKLQKKSDAEVAQAKQGPKKPPESAEARHKRENPNRPYWGEDVELVEELLQQIDEKSTPAWQRKEGKNPSGGLNAKGVASYRRANPGSKLKTAVTTKPSKLKKGSKAWNRRKSFCARMSGMKKRLTSAKTARDPDSRINKSLRKWNC